MKSEKYEVDLSSLHYILRNKRFYNIPPYQRQYNWDTSKVEELWEDIVNMYEDRDHRDDEYLLGSIVTVRKNDNTEDVVDGQQRLISLTLMFCALRESVKSYFDKVGDSVKIELKYAVDEINERVHKNNNVFIKLNNSKDESLFNAICRADNSKDFKKVRTRAGKALYKNYEELRRRAKSLCDRIDIANSNSNGIKELNEILKSMTEHVRLIDITVKDENDAQQIFETLNSKGQPLTQSDLIKSYLIRKSQDVKDDWSRAFAPFEKKIKDNHKKADGYIYDSLVSRNYEADGKDVGKRELYKAVKNRVKGKDDAKAFIAELEEDMDIVSKLEKPQSDSPLTHLLHGINQVDARYFRRPIIAAIRTWGWKDDKVKCLIEVLLKFFFMYRTVCKMDVDKLRSMARELTRMINNTSSDSIKITDLYRKIFEPIYKKDEYDKLDLEEFHERFLGDFINYEHTSSDITKYIFITIERNLQDEQLVIPEKGFDVEHIFPQKPTKNEWPNYGELTPYKNNIGNLTLLPRNWNNALKNYSFEVKKTGTKLNGQKIILTNKSGKIINDRDGNPIICSYENSRLALNQDLQKSKKWDRSEIKKRQSFLETHAKKVWDLREYNEEIKNAKEKV